MARKSTTGISLNLLNVEERQAFERLTPTQKAEYFGFGQGLRPNLDVPTYITVAEEDVKQKGNAFIVLGLDRPGDEFSGMGGVKNSHCAAIDIVAGRMGYRSAHRNRRGQLVNVNSNMKLDAARIYVSQKSDPDGNFGLVPGTVGNTSPSDPRSTVAIKADTLRFVARENIKFVTRTDTENSQGGKLSNALTKGYGIDLIAMNDDRDMQPLVKGVNLQNCLKELIESVHGLRELLNNFLMINRRFMISLSSHTHFSPFYGAPTSASPTLAVEGPNVLAETLANVEAQFMSHIQKLNAVEQNYLDATAGAEASDGDRGLFILSKYNNTN